MSFVRKALGRISGEELKVLLKHLARAWRSEELVPQPEGYISIPIQRIQPPRGSIRKKLGDLSGLKASIEREGVLQPIVVRPLDERWRRFGVVIGLRRYTACKQLGIERIPACVKDFGDERIALIALAENLNRKDLTQPEILHAMLRAKEKGYTLDRIAECSGIDKSEISVYLRAPELPKSVGDAFFGGEITFSHLRVLAGLDRKQMLELLKQIREQGLSRGDAEMVASAMKGRLELPHFFDRGEFLKHLRNLEFKKGKRSLTFAVRASDERELARILGKIVKLKELK